MSFDHIFLLVEGIFVFRFCRQFDLGSRLLRIFFFGGCSLRSRLCLLLVGFLIRLFCSVFLFLGSSSLLVSFLVIRIRLLLLCSLCFRRFFLRRVFFSLSLLLSLVFLRFGLVLRIRLFIRLFLVFFLFFLFFLLVLFLFFFLLLGLGLVCLFFGSFRLRSFRQNRGKPGHTGGGEDHSKNKDHGDQYL